MKKPYQPLRSIGLGCALLGLMWSSQCDAAEAERLMEEVVVTAIDRCGAWPIAHDLAFDCHYAELKRERLTLITQLRQRTRRQCLDCSTGQCVRKPLAASETYERFMCAKLFWTPIRVSRRRVPYTTSDPMALRFTYSISVKGRVEDIRIRSLSGDIPHETALRLLEEGARDTRFAPLEIDGARYVIADIEDAFVLDAIEEDF